MVRGICCTMKLFFLPLTCAITFSGCSKSEVPFVLYESETLIVKSTVDNIFTHVSYLQMDDLER